MSAICELGAEDLATFCVLWNAVWPTEPQQAEELRREDGVLPEDMRPRRWVLSDRRGPAGFAEARRPVGVDAPGKWELYVGVLRERRGRGMGRELADVGRAHLRRMGASRVETQVMEDDPASLGFARRRGYREIRRGFEALLDLHAVEEEALRALAHGPGPEVEIVTAASVDGPEFRRRWHGCFEEVRVDVPRTEPPEPLSFELFSELWLGEPTFSWNGTHIALRQRELIGFSVVSTAATPGLIYQGLTAVRRPWRGGGIAKALKARNILWAREAGYATMHTYNDSLNAAMLSINDRLGFRRQPAVLFLEANLPDH